MSPHQELLSGGKIRGSGDENLPSGSRGRSPAGVGGILGSWRQIWMYRLDRNTVKYTNIPILISTQ